MNYKTYQFYYKNDICNNLTNFKLFKGLVTHKSVGDNNIINFTSNLIKRENEIELKLGKIVFYVKEEVEKGYNRYELKEEEYDSIIFDKKTCKATGEKIGIEIFKNLEQNDDLIELLDILIELNPNVSNYFKTNHNLFSLELNSNNFYNFVNTVIFNYNELEKFINSNNMSFLIKNLNDNNFDIFENPEKNKLHQVVGLPKFALPMIKSIKLEAYIDSLQKIATLCDGNDFKILLEFLQNSKMLLFKKNILSINMEEFLEKLYYVLDINKNYKMVELLNYLLRQSYYYNPSTSFDFPNKEISFLKDYISMCEENNLKYEKYPQNLKKSHDIISKNINLKQVITQEMNIKFEEATICYSEVETIIKYDKKQYLFKVPTCIEDLIHEGNSLNHCIGSFANRIINNLSYIVFMRDNENPNNSLITIDISRDYNSLTDKFSYTLVEAKGNFNDDIDSEKMKIVHMWLKELNK